MHAVRHIQQECFFLLGGRVASSSNADGRSDDTDSDASIIIPRSDDEDPDEIEDALIEARCFSPRSRQSMGIGRQDLPSDSDEDEIPETDDDNDGDTDIDWTARLNSTRNRSLAKAGSSSNTAGSQSGVLSNQSVVDTSAHDSFVDHSNLSAVATDVNNATANSSTSGDVILIPNAKQETVVLSSDEDVSFTEILAYLVRI